MLRLLSATVLLFFALFSGLVLTRSTLVGAFFKYTLEMVTNLLSNLTSIQLAHQWSWLIQKKIQTRLNHKESLQKKNNLKAAKKLVLTEIRQNEKKN
jgi:hypothetical protein